MMENFDVPNTDSGSESINELVTGSHQFTVTGYSRSKGLGAGKFKSSDTFSVGGYDWIVYFYLDGVLPEDLDPYVSVFVAVDSEKTDARTHFDATLMDQSGKGNHFVLREYDSSYRFKTLNSVRGYDRFCRRHELESSDYLKNDTLEIKCTISVVTNRLEISKRDYIEIPLSNMGNEFKSLLDSGFGADITFSVDDEKFKAHKLVLSARSSIFKSQFVENPNLNEVEIVDIEPEVFKLMLQYIYSSELPNTLEFTTNTMHHLLVASVRYGLDRLRLFCESKLSEDMTVDDVATTLCLAEHHLCLQLKASCIKFVITNLKGVMQTKGFKDIEENFPSLVVDILVARAAAL